MESIARRKAASRAWLRWLAVVATALVIVVIAFLYSRSGSAILSTLQSPLVAAVAVASFLYLTLDRLREMTSRIDRIEGIVSSFWQEVFREIRGAASAEIKATIGEMQASTERSIGKLDERVNSIVSENKWLQHADPNELALYSKHLEPVYASAKLLARKGEVDTARRMITETINDPELQGTAKDFHNAAVFAAQELNDDLLAMQIHEIYFNSTEDPNPDVLADALEVYTRAEDYAKAEEYANLIRAQLDSCNPRFARRWRPWVFTADYYRAIGKEDEAIAVLQSGMSLVVDPEEHPHIVRNLGDVLQRHGKIDDAETAFRKCISEYPSHVPAYLQLAELLWLKGGTDEAIRVLRSSLSQGNLDLTYDHQVARVYVHLARLCTATKDHTAAKEYAARAAAMGRDRDVADLLRFHTGPPDQALRAGVALVLDEAKGALDEEQFRALQAAVSERLDREE